MSAFVDALRAADKAATGAPWGYLPWSGHDYGRTIYSIPGVCTNVSVEANARIITLLRNAAPEIAALVEAVDEASAVACQVGMVRYVEIDADEWARIRAALSRLEKTVKP